MLVARKFLRVCRQTAAPIIEFQAIDSFCILRGKLTAICMNCKSFVLHYFRLLLTTMCSRSQETDILRPEIEASRHWGAGTSDSEQRTLSRKHKLVLALSATILAVALMAQLQVF